MRLTWTLVALPALGTTAWAERPSEEGMADVAVAGGASHRGVAEDYLVAPSGGEVTGQMRFLTADFGPCSATAPGEVQRRRAVRARRPLVAVLS